MAVKVRVKLLAGLRHAADAEEVELTFDAEPSLDEIVEELSRRLPRLGAALRELSRRGIEVIAVVNGVAVDRRARVRDGSTVYLMPPTSGG